MDGLGIKSLGSTVWLTSVHWSCHTDVYTVNFAGCQAKLFKRNEKVLLEGKRNMIHSILSSAIILYHSHAKYFKSLVIHRSCSLNWYHSYQQFKSRQNKSLKTSMLLDMDAVNTQYSNLPSVYLWKGKAERWKSQQNDKLLKQVGQLSTLHRNRKKKKKQLWEHSFIPNHCIISVWLKIWGLHGQWTSC